MKGLKLKLPDPGTYNSIAATMMLVCVGFLVWPTLMLAILLVAGMAYVLDGQ